MILRLLLFLWLPLSVGKLDYLNSQVTDAVAIQHLLMIMFLFYAIAYAFQKGHILKINLYFMLFFGYTAINGLVMNLSIDVFFRIFAMFGVYQLASCVVRQMGFEEFLRNLCWSSAVFLLLSFAYILLVPSASFEQLQDRMVVSSFFAHKNSYGRFLQLSYLFLFSGWLVFRERRYLLFALLAIFGIVISDSRTSLSIAMLSTAIMLLVFYRQVFVRHILFGLLSLCLTGMYLWFSGNIELLRIGSIYDGLSVLGVDFNLTGRVTIWDAILRELDQQDAWLFGFGLGRFFNDDASFVLANVGLGDFIPNDAHNGFVDVLLNVGIMGLLLHFYSAWGLLRRLWFPGDCPPLQVAFGTSFVVCFFLANMTESYIIKSTITYTFLFWVLMLFMCQSDQEKHPATITPGRMQ